MAWNSLTTFEVQAKILQSAAAGQSISMCAYAGGIRPQELFTALREGHTGNGAFAEFARVFYMTASEAQKAVLEDAKLKPDVWLNHTREAYTELQSEHSVDFAEEMANASKDG